VLKWRENGRNLVCANGIFQPAHGLAPCDFEGARPLSHILSPNADSKLKNYKARATQPALVLVFIWNRYMDSLAPNAARCQQKRRAKMA
jgi:hypothetical protein